MKTTLLFLCVGTLALCLAATHRQVSMVAKASSPVTLADSIDKETGLVLDSNFMLVKAQCTSCHSPKLILQHRFTRDEWLSKIRWMQRNHKLWDLGESEKSVLDYLAKHYAPSQSAYSRREALRNIKWYKLEK